MRAEVGLGGRVDEAVRRVSICSMDATGRMAVWSDRGHMDRCSRLAMGNEVQAKWIAAFRSALSDLANG